MTTTQWGVRINWAADPDEPTVNQYDTRADAELGLAYWSTEVADDGRVELVTRELPAWEVAR